MPLAHFLPLDLPGNGLDNHAPWLQTEINQGQMLNDCYLWL
jgi:hypothetical protein